MKREEREWPKEEMRGWDDDTSSAVVGCAEPSVDGMAPRESGAIAWRHRFRRRRALTLTGSFRFALSFRLTHLGCSSGTKRLRPTPIFSGPTQWAPLSSAHWLILVYFRLRAVAHTPDITAGF